MLAAPLHHADITTDPSQIRVTPRDFDSMEGLSTISRQMERRAAKGTEQPGAVPRPGGAVKGGFLNKPPKFEDRPYEQHWAGFDVTTGSQKKLDQIINAYGAGPGKVKLRTDSTDPKQIEAFKEVLGYLTKARFKPLSGDHWVISERVNPQDIFELQITRTFNVLRGRKGSVMVDHFAFDYLSLPRRHNGPYER